MFSLLEFLYQVIAILGIEHPLLPLSLPERILSIVPHGTGNDCIAYLQKIADIWNRSPDNGQNALQCNFLSSEAKADERSHAMLGYLLSLQDGHFAEALSTWQPLLSNRPSKMEYLAAISFCDQSRLSLIGKPAFLTFDTWVLEGLLRSRRKISLCFGVRDHFSRRSSDSHILMVHVLPIEFPSSSSMRIYLLEKQPEFSLFFVSSSIPLSRVGLISVLYDLISAGVLYSQTCPGRIR